MGARRLDAQTFGASGRPYDRLWVSPGAQAVVLLGTDGSAAHPGGCSSTGGPTRLIVTDRAGRMLAETLSECPLMHVRLRNNGARVAHWRVYVLRRHRSWPGGAMKLVASRTGLGVSPLWLSDHTQGWAGNSATSPGLMAVAAVDPGSGDHGRYLPEAYANGGPQCWHLGGATAGRPSGIARGCIRQPVFAAPDRTQVAMPAGNARGYRDKPFTGDSAASPAAAGAAALLLAKRVAPQEIESLLEHTARPQGAVVGWTSPRERTPRTVFVLRERVMNRGADQPLFIAACGGDEERHDGSGATPAPATPSPNPFSGPSITEGGGWRPTPARPMPSGHAQRMQVSATPFITSVSHGPHPTPCAVMPSCAQPSCAGCGFPPWPPPCGTFARSSARGRACAPGVWRAIMRRIRPASRERWVPRNGPGDEEANLPAVGLGCGQESCFLVAEEAPITALWQARLVDQFRGIAETLHTPVLAGHGE